MHGISRRGRRARLLATAGLLALGGAALAACETPGGAEDVVDPRLTRFCQQIGYAPGPGEPYRQCLETYSVAGLGKEFDAGAAGLDGGPPLPN